MTWEIGSTELLVFFFFSKEKKKTLVYFLPPSNRLAFPHNIRKVNYFSGLFSQKRWMRLQISTLTWLQISTCFFHRTSMNQMQLMTENENKKLKTSFKAYLIARISHRNLASSGKFKVSHRNFVDSDRRILKSSTNVFTSHDFGD